MNKTSLLLLAGFSTGFLSLSSQAQVLFSDDFESGNIGAQWVQNEGISDVQDETTATPFGSPNQYAQIIDTSTNSTNFVRVLSGTQSGAYNAVTTFSFDFYEPDNSLASNLIFGYAGFDSGGSRYDLNSAGRRASATLNNGTIGGLSGGTTTTYSLDTAYTVHMLLNDTTTATTFLGVNVGAETAHVWFEALDSGTFNYAGSVAAANSSDSDGYRVGFRTFNADTQEVWVDNVELSVIPEPSTLALLLGSLGLLVLRRRRA